MLKIHTFPLGAYQTNCYIVHDESASSCAIIDPGFTPERVLEYVGKLGLTVDAIGGEVLVVSQFTLYGNCRKGRRPSFADAAGPELGERLYEQFLKDCEVLGFPPQHGRFGADMKVESINDGPITLILDTDQLMDSPRR